MNWATQAGLYCYILSTKLGGDIHDLVQQLFKRGNSLFCVGPFQVV